MLILGLLGMYFDAAVVFVTKSSLFFRLAVAILWRCLCLCYLFLSSLTQLRTFTSCKVPNSTSCRRLRESDQIVPLVGFENQNLSNLKVCFTLFKK